MQAHTVPNLYREIRDQLEYSVDDGRGFVHRIVWTPDHEPEAVRLEVHPDAPLCDETLDVLVEQPSDGIPPLAVGVD